MSRELKVGVFVLTSALIFLGTFLYVANVQLRGVRIPYKTYFKYAGGVDPGSPVRFGGMKAGAITAVHPWREDPTKIEVLLELKEGVPVNADSAATLTSLSPLGDKYLEITTGTSKARRLPPGATIRSAEPVSLDDLAKQVSAIIPTVQSTLQDAQKDIDQLTRNAALVLANVQSITGPQNQRNIALLLANARQLLDKESPRIDSVLQNLERASLQASGALKQASGALNEVQTAARTANDTFANANRTIDDIRDPVQKGLAELQSTMTDARRLIADLNAVVSLDNRQNIDETLENFRAASENLRELTASVKQRPWALLRGKPAPDRPVPVVAGAH
jgi:phospholipid/cholesterol/gamma-HCH transport system substrate-binding protein